MKHFFIQILLILTAAISCKNKSEKDIYSSYKPILIENSKLNICEIQTARENKNIQKIEYLGNYILALEYGLGIHIIDNSNTNSPQKIGFYFVPACVDFEVKNNTLYANNYKDLIVVDFSNALSPTISKRETNAFNIKIKTPDGIAVFEDLNKTPSNATIISYEKI